MSDMINNLDRIVAHLRRLGRGAPDRLQQGLSQQELASWESQLPFALTGELVALYQWRDGTKAEEGDLLEDLYFFPGFYFLSMEEAVQTFKEMEEAPQWSEGWFPVFADGGGNFYIVPCTAKKVDESEVIGFLHGEPDQIAEYESVSSMIETLEACFTEGAFFVDVDDTMEIDDDKHREIANRINPGIPEWQS